MRRASAFVGMGGRFSRIGPVGRCSGGPALRTLLRTRLNADIRSTDPGRPIATPTRMRWLRISWKGLVAFRDDTSIGRCSPRAGGFERRQDYTFRLRQGIKFHNGATMTADDVVWSLKALARPGDANGDACPNFSATGIARNREDRGAGSARLLPSRSTSRRRCFFDPSRRPIAGRPLSSTGISVGTDGKWIAPIGTGPFKLGEWRRGQYMDLVRFDGYVPRSEPRTRFTTGAKDVKVDRVRFI